VACERSMSMPLRRDCQKRWAHRHSRTGSHQERGKSEVIVDVAELQVLAAGGRTDEQIAGGSSRC
jgi:hypothetical protein